jgi:hypothetical protein
MAKFEEGTRVRVRIAGVRGQKQGPDLLLTTQVTETTSAPIARNYEHFLYLGSGKVRVTGNAVTTAFDAEVGDRMAAWRSRSVGDLEADAIRTTRVRELSSYAGLTGYSHYVDLDSPAVTVLELCPDGQYRTAEERAAITGLPVEPEPPEPERLSRSSRSVSEEPSRKGTTVSISGSYKEISYRPAEARIKELKKATATAYEVVRVRNDEVLAGGYADEDDARRYITDNDYDTDRVIVRKTDPDEEDVDELTGLQDLNAECERKFGSAWSEDRIVLYRESYFDAEWARRQAVEKLGVGVGDTRSWPLALVNWDAAAVQRRESDYALVPFDGEKYYGKDL